MAGLPLTRSAFIRRGDGASEANWLERSPIRIDWEPGPRDALAVLDALWLPDELLFVDQFMGNSVNTDSIEIKNNFFIYILIIDFILRREKLHLPPRN